MAFRDPVTYLVIKIWINLKLPKIALQPKIGLMKIENPIDPIATKRNWTRVQSCNSMLLAYHCFD